MAESTTKSGHQAIEAGGRGSHRPRSKPAAVEETGGRLRGRDAHAAALPRPDADAAGSEAHRDDLRRDFRPGPGARRHEPRVERQSAGIEREGRATRCAAAMASCTCTSTIASRRIRWASCCTASRCRPPAETRCFRTLDRDQRLPAEIRARIDDKVIRRKSYLRTGGRVEPSDHVHASAHGRAHPVLQQAAGARDPRHPRGRVQEPLR